MMKSIKYYFRDFYLIVVVIFGFFFTRIFNIMSLPIFTDEAIYTRWAQIARFDANWRFISLTDGKQPSFVWVDMIFMKFFQDPLLAGRMVSVAFGFIAMLGLFFIALELFKSRKIALLTSALYVLYPIALLHDRMALYESILAAFFLWSLYLQIKLVRTLRLDVALILGLVLGASVLTKSSGFLSIYMMPLLLILFDFGKKNLKQRIMKFAILAVVSSVMAFGIYSILRLSPFFHIVAEKNLVFVQTPSEWLKLTFNDKISTFLSNSKRLWEWFFIYFTIPFALLVVAVFFLKKKFVKESLLLILWFLLPMIALSVSGKTIYPRYILFMSLTLLPIVSLSLVTIARSIRKRALLVLLFLFVLILPFRAAYYIVFDMARAPIPELDLEQYINGWPAGGGVVEANTLFRKESKDKEVYVATQGTFGLLPAAFEAYNQNNPNITIKGYWPTNSEIPEEVLEQSKTKTTYFVFYQDCRYCEYPGDAPENWPLKKIAEYKKGIGDTTLSIYQVVP